MVRLPAPQHLADPVIDRRVGGVVLAIHLEIDAQRRPARAEIRLPLQLHLPAGDRQRPFPPGLVVEGDRAFAGVDLLHRHIKHPPGLGVDRQEAGIGLLPLLAQAGQHDLHDVVIALGGMAQRVVEIARLVEVGRREELVLEAEGVEEPPQHGVVVVAEAREFAERVGHARSAAAAGSRAASPGCGTLSGTLRIPSMSSEKQISRVGISEITSKARRIIVVRATSPKVPICGRPEGP